MKPTIDRELVSPKQALAYLESNANNRPLQAKRVNSLVAAIKRGEWQENGETVKFNGDGSLLDGQHRLAAIAKSGRSVPLIVVRGLPTETQETMDIGSTRTVGNMLAIRGYKNANALASSARMIWTYRKVGEPLPMSVFIRATPQQVLEVVDELGDVLGEWLSWGSSIYRRDRALRMSPTVIGTLGYLYAEVSSEEDAKAFFNELVTPRHKSDPTALLRSRLLQQGFHNPMAPRMRLALVIKAWNAWINGERPVRLTWRAGGASKEDFPRILGLPEEK